MQLNKRFIATLLIPAFLGQTVAIPAWAAAESLTAPLPPELAEFSADLRTFCLEQIKAHPENDQVLVELELGGQMVMVDCTEAVKVVGPTVESRAGEKGEDCVDCALKAKKATTGAEPMADLAAQAVRAAAKPEASAAPQPQLSCPADPEAAAQESLNACLAGNAALVLPEETLPAEASVTARFKAWLNSFGKPSTKLDACRQAAGVSGSAAGGSASCASKAVSELLVGILSGITGFADLIFGVAPKIIAEGAKRLAKGAVNLFKSLFTTNAGMEDKVSDKLQMASQTPPDSVEQFYDDPAGFLSNMAKGMYHIMTNYLDIKAKSMGCTKWSGVPDESECLAGSGGYACMTAKQKNDVLCAGTGAFVGNFLLGSVGIGAIAGIGAAITAGVKGTTLASKTSALLKGALASSKGQAVGSAAAKAISATMKVARSQPAMIAFKTARVATKPIALTVKGSVLAAKWTGDKIKRVYGALKKIPVAGDALSATAFALKTVFVTADNYGMAFGSGLFGKGGMKAVHAYRAEQAVELASKLRQEANAAQEAVKATTLAEVRVPVLQDEIAKLPKDAANQARRTQLEGELAQQNKIVATRGELRKKSEKADKVALDAENAVLAPLSKALKKNEGIETKAVQGDDGQRMLEVVNAPEGSPLDVMLSSTRSVTQKGNPLIGDSVPNGRIFIRSSTKAASDMPAVTMTPSGNYIVDPDKALRMNAQQWMDAVGETKVATDMKRAGFEYTPELTRAVVGADTVRALRDEADSLEATRTLMGDNSAKPVFVQPSRAQLDQALATSNTQFVDAVSQVARQAGNKFERLPDGSGVRFFPDDTTGAGQLAGAVGPKSGKLGPDDLGVVARGDNASGTTYVDGQFVVIGPDDMFNQARLKKLAGDVVQGCTVTK